MAQNKICTTYCCMVGPCVHSVLFQQVLVLWECLRIASGLLSYFRSCTFSPGKNPSFHLWGLPAHLPPALCLSLSVYLNYSLQLAVILFRGQKKVNRNHVSASTCSVLFGKRDTFSPLGESLLSHTSTKRMRQKGNDFTTLSSNRAHGTHISCCRLVLWYQFYLPFNTCNGNACPLFVSFSPLAEHNSHLSHRNRIFCFQTWEERQDSIHLTN